MATLDVELLEESRSRYLTYALSVVSSRALPDVRDGLKPVQRRILFAMGQDLRLFPGKPHRKSAAVVGEVLAKYHPHGDSACYEAMVRMAQDFSLRYPLVDGQGNFGSLDGDSAAAYRYTEARLTELAIEVLGDIGEQTVALRDNFDQTVKEPVVLPSRVPNLLINGASGIAVGMATAIPPHNLGEIVKGLCVLLDDPEAPEAKILSLIKGPDFPTGCSLINSKDELREIYRTGRGAVRMRADYEIEDLPRGKRQIVVTSIPYAVDKSDLVVKIADLIIGAKVPQLEDVRDESTDKVRIVIELASDADDQAAMAYLFKHTTLQTNFNVNLTALVPTENPLTCRPVLLSLRQMLLEFATFRIEVTRAKLEYEKQKLKERIHLLEGIILIYDYLDEAIEIVRRSKGRGDAADALRKRFSLSEVQSLFIVDLRIYQLAQTAIEEVRQELAEKIARVSAINEVLKSDAKLRQSVKDDLQRLVDTYGDARRSKIEHDAPDLEFREEAYIKDEDVFIILTKDGWLKRVRQSVDPSNTRVREGDALFLVAPASTRDSLAIFTTLGNLFVIKVHELSAGGGFGEPVQKVFRFQDGEAIVHSMVLEQDGDGFKKPADKICLYTRRGLGFLLDFENLAETKKTGKRLMKVSDTDALAGVLPVQKELLLFISSRGYGLCVASGELPTLGGAGKGVIIQRMPDDDFLIVGASVSKNEKIKLELENDHVREVDVQALSISVRAKRGNKVFKRGGNVLGLVRK